MLALPRNVEQQKLIFHGRTLSRQRKRRHGGVGSAGGSQFALNNFH